MEWILVAESELARQLMIPECQNDLICRCGVPIKKPTTYKIITYHMPLYGNLKGAPVLIIQKDQ